MMMTLSLSVVSAHSSFSMTVGIEKSLMNVDTPMPSTVKKTDCCNQMIIQSTKKTYFSYHSKTAEMLQYGS
jgi:hypothetical protein